MEVGQDLDVVERLFSTPFNVLDHVFASDLSVGARDLAEQVHGAIGVDLVGEVVEYAVVREASRVHDRTSLTTRS